MAHGWILTILEMQIELVGLENTSPEEGSSQAQRADPAPGRLYEVVTELEERESHKYKQTGTS